MKRYALSAIYFLLALACVRSSYIAIQADQFVLAAFGLILGACAWVVGLARLTGGRL